MGRRQRAGAGWAATVKVEGTTLEPLEGLRVLDFSRQLAGGAATRILANYGAEVLRAEWPEPPGIDFLRQGGSSWADGPKSINAGPLFNSINVAKRSFTLNMATEEGRRLAKELARISDVFFESMTPRVMRNWGLEYEAVRGINPNIIYVSCSGFGQTGPAAHYRSYGMPSAAHTGIFHLAGLPGRPPARWGFSIGDTHASFMNAIAVLSAVHYRQRTGRGVFIDSAQTQANITLLAEFFLDFSVNGRKTRHSKFPPGNTPHRTPVAPHNAYPCRGQDTWCVIAAFSEADWKSLKDAMKHPEWAERPQFASMEERVQHREELDRELSRWTRGFDRFVLARRLQESGLCAGVVENSRDRLNWDGQLAHRGTYAIFEHSEMGPRRHETVAAKLSGRLPRPKRAPPSWAKTTTTSSRICWACPKQRWRLW